MERQVKCPKCGRCCKLTVKKKGSLRGAVGKIPKTIDVAKNKIVFTFQDNSSCTLFHETQCCEEVYIEDVNGRWKDLIGNELLVAEERSSTEAIPKKGTCSYSCTWTFYTFRSIKGSVDVRWLGSSNGCYSEAVDIMFCPAK